MLLQCVLLRDCDSNDDSNRVSWQGMTLSAFAEEALWQPMGAEADATWCTDSHGNEFNCVNFQCRLRDWAR